LYLLAGKSLGYAALRAIAPTGMRRRSSAEWSNAKGTQLMPEVLKTLPRSWTQRFLDTIEWLGNRLPDPAILFVYALGITWATSWLLANVQFSEIDPTTLYSVDGKTAVNPQTIKVINQLSGPSLVTFFTNLVKNFVEFPPLGVVLVALLGVGVAEHTGFINALIKTLMSITPKRLLTPMLLFVAILSHSAGDSGYVLVIPLGGIIFATAGRHPIAGIVAAFAGVSGGFSASILPSSLDPLLQGFTEAAAKLLDPSKRVNPLCNYYFTSASALLIMSVGWWITDCVVEPRLAAMPVDADAEAQPRLDALGQYEIRGMIAGLLSLALAFGCLALAAYPNASPLRSPPPKSLVTANVVVANPAGTTLTVPTEKPASAPANQVRAGSLFSSDAPLMKMIVPLIFLFFLLPGTIHGFVSGTVKSHRDIVAGMTKSMGAMSYYLVLAFFAAQFTAAFRDSKVGVLLAVKGAEGLKSLDLLPQVTIVGIILISAVLDLIVGSASAKWALLGPIFVPMLMSVGISPELTQAAYRVGDSCMNIMTPLMPYFPLVVLYCQRYVKRTGIGTLISLMLPYSLCFMVSWIVLLLTFWGFGWPLGLDATYSYSMPVAN
jgi:aminobenzoyl-glutamate transport protein